ncbi:hypothetical protein [Paenibacillus sp. 453mf]|uniref:hypothetical protein n=1 Tax=Paenibacillus sp. 453mf TaxID=1761874 RepID=UPI0008EB532A|nr:hypothetical protein [Paenibacillus sp. 453mf]SFT00883.1 hypothetical protein SAMN04488601_1217 [Paenibacillus sp. 453mf]
MNKKFTLMIAFGLCISLLITQVIYASAAYKLTEEAIEFISKSSRKTDLKLVYSSVQVKNGAKFDSAADAVKMQEAGLSRTPLTVVESLQKSAERATPVEGKPGWVKTFIGAGVFLTGADIGYEIFDMINGVDPEYDPDKIQRYSENFIAGSGDTLVGSNGLSYNWEYVTDRYGVTSAYLKITSSVVAGAWWMVNTDGSLGYMSWANAVPYPEDAAITKWEFQPNTGSGASIFTVATSGNEQELVRTIKLSGWDNYYISSSTAGWNLVEGPLTGVTQVPAVEPVMVPMTEPWADIYPGETQLVELTYPDPATVTNVGESIATNQEAIRNSETNPTDPEDPTAPTKPSGDWPDTLGGIFTTRFPFSLPWDLYRMIEILNAVPMAPEVNINQNFMGMPFIIQYSFSYLDPYMPWFRSIIIVGFCIFLIMGTRSLLGGAK